MHQLPADMYTHPESASNFNYGDKKVDVSANQNTQQAE